jgi:hypothetical protein
LYVTTTFPSVTLRAGIVQEILQRLEHKRTELSTIPIGTLEELTFQYHGEKILGQVLSVVNRMALATDESENRSPIDFAKFGKGSVRLLFVPFRICAG